jgi:hypothetical protein
MPRKIWIFREILVFWREKWGIIGKNRENLENN